MKETLLKLIDMCKNTKGLYIEINNFSYREVFITIDRNNKRVRRVISRESIEAHDDIETLINTIIKYCDDVMKSEEGVG